MTGLEILVVIGLSALAVALWPSICAWFADHCNPWLKRHVPSLQPYLEKAFLFVDKAVSAVRGKVIEAWHKVRESLLQAVVEFIRRSDGTWARRLTSYAQAEQAEKVTKRVEEHEMDWSELPEDVRAEALSRGSVERRDFTKDRDREVAVLAAETGR